jgi:ATP-dependent Clp protease adaptor protein ClpS
LSQCVSETAAAAAPRQWQRSAPRRAPKQGAPRALIGACSQPATGKMTAVATPAERLYRIDFMSRAASSPTPPAPPSRPESGQGAVVAERQARKTAPPRMYRVVMLNDDFTPMEFVVLMLQRHFGHGLESATHIMLKIHHEGRGVCGVYSRDIAATKVELVLASAKRAGHPLQCIMEAA